MKNIRIQRLTLENFKCHERLTLDFMGQPEKGERIATTSARTGLAMTGNGSANIYGDNATGKTSVYDALTWLLFGKDSHGNGEKNIDIKPLGPDGSVKDHQALTSVEAVLVISDSSSQAPQNDMTVTLKRTLRELWTSRRGSSELVFEGNTSDYFVDDVPMKKIEFGRRVAELVNEDVFRLLTSVTFFAQELEWKQRRSILHALSGVDALNDRAILAKEERFAPLLEALAGRSVEALGKVLAGKRKGLIGVKDETPTRINECEQALIRLAAVDFDAAQMQLDDALRKKDAAQTDLRKLQDSSARGEIENKLGKIALDRQKLELDNERYKAAQAADQPDPEVIRGKISRLEQRCSWMCSELQAAAKAEQKYETEIENRRKTWIECNGQRFAGGECPTCGQRLPVEQIKKATERFEKDKQDRLSAIEKIAEDYCARLDALRREMLDREKARKAAEDELQELKDILAKAEAARGEIRDMDGFSAQMRTLDDQQKALTAELREITDDSAKREIELRRQISGIESEIDNCRQTLAKRVYIDFNNERILALREQARKTAEELEKVEALLYLIDDFVRYKTGFIEDSVNGCFRLARFRLFREQANGGVEARCDVVYDGVPYASLNSGAKINVGIDIINTLSGWYGVRVPLFVDNAESVTRLEETCTQVIRLVVSEQDRKLRLETLDGEPVRYGLEMDGGPVRYGSEMDGGPVRYDKEVVA